MTIKKLTAAQRELVSENLYLVDKVIHFDIKRNLHNPDYAYEDLYQTGCIGLCMAAAAYDGSAPFPAYSRKAVYHHLIDYCRGVNRHGLVDCLDAFTDTQLSEAAGSSYESVVDEAAFLVLLENISEIKQRYSGVTLKGITALELKLKGLSGTDIARMYGVAPNQVSAWIARAKQRLLSDRDFLAAIS